MGDKKLVVISMDALIYEDLTYLMSKENFGWLINSGAMVERVRSIYPSLTYPCHITMATGCYPDKHGVINNTANIAGSDNPPWLFDHVHVKQPDILDACKQAGLTTAAVGWPVSGNHPAVDYLVNECWPDKGSDAAAFRDIYLRNGTDETLFNEIVAPVLWMRLGRKQPDSSFFLTQISAEIIRRHKPDVLIMHQGNVDNYRHKTGVFSPLVTEGLDQCETMLGLIIQATKDAGVFEQTDFVVTADHGHLNCSRTVHLNTLLVERGFIDVDTDGVVRDWRAYCFPTGMSALIQLHDPMDKALYQSVYDLMQEVCASGLWGISKVFTREEVSRRDHLDGDFSFVLETDNASVFGRHWCGPSSVPSATDLIGARGGYHGYHPDKGPRPTFLACGPSFKAGARISSANLVDGAPTYAKVLGVSLPNTDGRVLSELLKEYEL